MTRWLLDTNVVAELQRPQPNPLVAAWLSARPEAALFISVLTLGEYEQGITQLPAADPRRARHVVGLQALRAGFAGRILIFDEAAALRWGGLMGAGRRLGRTPPIPDTMLAAQAIEAGMTFVTRNTRDVVATGASLLNPWTDDPSATGD